MLRALVFDRWSRLVCVSYITLIEYCFYRWDLAQWLWNTIQVASYWIWEPFGAEFEKKKKRRRRKKRILIFFFEIYLILIYGYICRDSAGSSLQCGCCKKTYYGKETHLELTVSGGSSKYDDSMPLATEMFRYSPLGFFYCLDRVYTLAHWLGCQ